MSQQFAIFRISHNARCCSALGFGPATIPTTLLRMRRFLVLALKHGWKYGVPVLIAAGVGYYFYGKLSQPELWSTNLVPRAEWLIPAALVYVLAYTVWGRYYVTLLRYQCAHVATATGLRAYFISQMGKYVPGKVLV